MQIQVVYSGRNYDAAGGVPRHLTLPEGCSVDEALLALRRLFPPEQPLDDSCLVAVSGAHLGTVRKHRPHQLQPGDELMLIAPVAGG